MLADLNRLAQKLDADEIGPFVDDLAKRIALWPSEAIIAAKQAVYESIDQPRLAWFGRAALCRRLYGREDKATADPHLCDDGVGGLGYVKRHQISALALGNVASVMQADGGSWCFGDGVPGSAKA